MKLIVGLGNPGEKFKNTRHNAGYMAIDELSSGEIPKGIIVKKSDVFMNDSGRSVKSLVDFYKVDPNDLYVIHDDLDVRLGEYKIQKGVGPKDHNGINSVEEKIGADDFWRVRIGVDNRQPDNRIEGEDYVLMRFSEREIEMIGEVIKKAMLELKERL